MLYTLHYAGRVADRPGRTTSPRHSTCLPSSFLRRPNRQTCWYRTYLMVLPSRTKTSFYQNQLPDPTFEHVPLAVEHEGLCPQIPLPDTYSFDLLPSGGLAHTVDTAPHFAFDLPSDDGTDLYQPQLPLQHFDPIQPAPTVTTPGISIPIANMPTATCRLPPSPLSSLPCRPHLAP